MWRFSDGTEVDPGGEVRGLSLFAQGLRLQIEDGRARVGIWAQPSGSVEVKLDDTGLVNAWLDQELDRETRIDGRPLKMTERHDPIAELPPPPWKAEDLVEGRVY